MALTAEERLVRDAARKGQKDTVQQGLLNGVDPNAFGAESKCRSLLHEAVIFNRLAIVFMLLAAGADINMTTHTADNKRTPLYFAAQCNWLPIVKVLLAAGADAFAVTQVEIAKLLVQDKMTPFSKDGKTAYHRAKSEKDGRPEVAELLAQHMSRQKRGRRLRQ